MAGSSAGGSGMFEAEDSFSGERQETKEKRNIFIEAIDKIISFLANIHIGITQRVFCYYVGGFEEIQFQAVVKK